MDAALEEAEKRAERGEVPIGAVVVLDGEIIARAGNRTRELNDITAHAEVVAIREASAVPRRRAADGRRPLCHAGALHHVRGGDLLRPHPPPLLRRGRSQGRRGRQRRAVLRLADLPPRAGCLFRACRARKPPTFSGISLPGNAESRARNSQPAAKAPAPHPRAGSASTPTSARRRRPRKRGLPARSSRARSIRSGHSLPRRRSCARCFRSVLPAPEPRQSGVT